MAVVKKQEFARGLPCAQRTPKARRPPSRRTGLNDPQIRAALRESLGRRFDYSDAVIVEELGLCQGQVRVDLAAVNGILHGFEIKSERDSLRRLKSQDAVYSGVFDRVTLVATQRHLGSATKTIPAWWETVLADRHPDGVVRLTTIRPGTNNPALQPRLLVELLWRDDALALLEARGKDLGYRTKRREEIWDRLCESYSPEEIRDTVCRKLKARAGM